MNQKDRVQIDRPKRIHESEAENGCLVEVARRSDMGSNFVSKWHVVMVAGCNLRCSYCATDYGRFGQAGGAMTLETAVKLAERIAECVDPELRDVFVSFGGGETFLHFDLFLQMCDLIVERCRESGARAHIDVTTNGVLLDEKRLQILAHRNVGLTFSIDGPEWIHDGARRTVAGEGTFKKAYANWLRYREITKGLVSKPPCAVHSVFGSHSGSLQDVSDFWLKQGLGVLELMPTNTSRFDTIKERRKAKSIHDVYLNGLSEWAMDQVKTCGMASFLSDYRGPAILFNGWWRLLMEREKTFCTPARGTLAVGSDGALYPCEPYVGLERWKLGDLTSGIHPQRLAAFVAKCTRAEAVCKGCEHRLACEKPCFGLIAKDTPAQNVKRHCWVAKRVACIVVDSFNVMKQNDLQRGNL